MIPSATPAWYLYFCQRDDALTSLAVDLTFGQEPEDAGLTWLTVIRIGLLEPRDGLAVGAEAETIDAMQEQLEQRANRARTGLRRLFGKPHRFRYVGRSSSRTTATPFNDARIRIDRSPAIDLVT